MSDSDKSMTVLVVGENLKVIRRDYNGNFNARDERLLHEATIAIECDFADGKLELEVVKNRQGVTGVIHVELEGSSLRVST